MLGFNTGQGHRICICQKQFIDVLKQTKFNVGVINIKREIKLL